MRKINFGYAPFGSYSTENPAMPDKPMAVFRPYQSTWPKLKKLLTTFHPTLDKTRAPNVSFCSFKEKLTAKPFGEKNKRTLVQRANKNVESVECIWLDIDKVGSIGFDDMQDRLDLMGWNYAMYTTWSYDGSNIKYRVVLPLKEPLVEVSREKLVGVVNGLAGVLGLAEGQYDMASSVPAQLMYLPSCTPGRLAKKLPRSVFVSEGEYLDLEELGLGSGESGVSEGESGGLGSSAGRSGGLTNKNPIDVDVGERHEYLKKWLVRLMKEGVDQEEISRRLRGFNALFGSPLAEEEVNGILVRVRESIVGGSGGLGMLALRELLEAVEEIGDDGLRKLELERLVKRVGLSLAEGVLSLRDMRAMAADIPRKCRRVMKAEMFKALAEQHAKNYRSTGIGLGSRGVGGLDDGLGGGLDDLDYDMIGDDELLGDAALFDGMFAQLGSDDDQGDGKRGDGKKNGGGAGSKGRELWAKFFEDMKLEFSNFVFLRELEKVLDVEGRVVYTQSTFEKVCVPGRVDRVLDKDKRYYDIFVSATGIFRGVPRDFVLSKGVLAEMDDVGYLPGGEETYVGGDGRRFWNKWRSPVFVGVRDGIVKGRVKGFLNWLSMAMDRVDREIVLDLLAWLVGRPGQRLYWMPIVCGTNGCGKSLLMSELVGKLVGEENVCTFTTEEFSISTGFNSKFAGHQIAVCHEVDSRGVKEFRSKWEALKGELTSDSVSFMKKGQESFMGPNVVTRLGCSNAAEPFSISKKERRVVFLTLTGVTEDVVGLERYRDEDVLGSQGYEGLGTGADLLEVQMSGLYNWMQDQDNIEALVEYLERREVRDSFYVNAPSNRRTEAIKGVDDSFNTIVEELTITGIGGNERLTLLDEHGACFIQEKRLIKLILDALDQMLVPDSVKQLLYDKLTPVHHSKVRAELHNAFLEAGWRYRDVTKMFKTGGKARLGRNRKSVLFYNSPLHGHSISEEIWAREEARLEALQKQLQGMDSNSVDGVTTV